MRGFRRNHIPEFNPADDVTLNATLNPLRSNPTQPAQPSQGVTQNAESRRQRNAADHGHPEETRLRGHAFPLGTREDVQQDDYVSPIFGMFNRAWTRYRDAEEERTTVQSAAATQEGSSLDDEDHQVITHHSNGSREIDFLHVRQENTPPSTTLSRALARQHLLDASPLTIETMLRAGEAQMNTDTAQAAIPNGVQHALSARREYTDHNNAMYYQEVPRLGYVNGNVQQPNRRADRRGFHAQFYSNPFDERAFRYHNDGQTNRPTGEDPSDRINPIDAQRLRRPAPAQSEDLKVNFACKICQEQKIDSICMPCMHATTCRWCAEIFKDECRDASGRFDHRLWKCVLCRKQIKEVKRFYI